jgi:hypothetical protein
MHKSAGFIILLFLSACSLPFIQQPAAPTQALLPTAVDLEATLPDAAVAVTLAADEAMPSAEEVIAATTCPDCTDCEDDLDACQADATEMAATIVAFEAFGGEAMPDLASTATPDMSGGMPPLTATSDNQAAMPTLTATIDPQSGGLPTATLDAVPPLPEDGVRYRADAVTYKKNFAHLDRGCNWLGVAGQVLDGSGNPVTNLVVVAEGVLQGEEILQVDITGLHGAYGPGGYEIELSNSVVATTNMIYITVYDLDGSALSSPISIATRADCNQNLLILNFQQAQ